MTYHLIIDDIIGSWGYSKQWVARQLAQYQGQHVDVKISSRGGDLDHGLDIRRQFLDHGDVTVYICGMTASAATVIATGAKRVVMSPGSFYLVHKCSNFIDAWGSYNADQMQQLIEELTENKKENDRIDVVLAQIYAERCGKQVSDILDILRAGRWLSPQQALELGFIDEISDVAGEVKMNFTADVRAKLNAFGLSLEGLPVPEDTAETHPKDDQQEQTHTQPTTTISSMDDHKFASVASLLGLDTIVADNDGYVSITADQMGKVNDRLEALQKQTADSAKAKEDSAKEISGLKTRVDALTRTVENLKRAPGAETTDIKDEGGESSQRLNSSDMYNQIKDLI